MPSFGLFLQYSSTLDPGFASSIDLISILIDLIIIVTNGYEFSSSREGAVFHYEGGIIDKAEATFIPRKIDQQIIIILQQTMGAVI